MSNAVPPDNKALLQKALVELRDMRAKLKAYEQAATEPIAIVGMGCRLPGGVGDPQAYWRMLRDGVCAIREVPRERWDIDALYDPDPAAGKCYARHGGYVQGLEEFDPHFFGMSPREAASLDPQQRMLLEVSWSALEDAGISPESLYGTNTGVFVGVSSFEFALSVATLTERERVDPYYGSGAALAPTAGRLSYHLGLTGPSMAVDTACSSSLVSVHLACQSLRRGECGVALAAGVNLLMSPAVHLAFCMARMLARDGLCKTFDARADGYVRGEGCGVVVLKRLSTAVADGDRILALIRGSAVNQDGPSGALTVPSGPSQQSVIRQALAGGGVKPDQVSYIEAHGTGTALGDPIEIRALASVFGSRRERPLITGSVKTNIGHLESAAGIAGLLKVVLALQHREIPPHLHFQRPNPNIPWQQMSIEIPVERRPWPAGDGPRIAGISSFGFSGTNAHLVVEEAPELPREAAENDRPCHVLVLSAKTPQALREMALQYRDWLTPDLSVPDVCFTAANGRAHFPHRLGAVASSIEELRDKLGAFAEGCEASGLKSGKAPGEDARRVAFLLPREDSWHAGLGRELYETAPVFRSALDECEAVFKRQTGHSLLPATSNSPEAEPAFFALQYGLLNLLRSWGVEVGAVAGEGMGEYVAACAAGVFSTADALSLIVERSHLMREIPVAAGVHGAALNFHTQQRQVSRRVEYSPARIGVISPFTGKAAGDEIATPEYWTRHAPVAVDIAASARAFAESGYEAVSLPTLQRGSEWEQLLDTVATMHVRGVKIDWRAFDAPYARRRVALPTYPFQRQRCWSIQTENHESASRGESAPDDWFYTEQWQRDDSSAEPVKIGGAWLILADAGGMGHELAAVMEAGGAQCTLVFRNDDRDRLHDVDGLAGIVHLWSLDTDSGPMEGARMTCGSTLELVRAVSTRRLRTSPQLVLVTRGAQSVATSDAPPDMTQAALWGLGKVIAIENPELACRLIDLDSASGASALYDVIPRGREPIAIRNGQRYVSRLTRLKLPAQSSVVFKPDATYLITGGVGGVGRELARWLIEHGARHLALVSRTAASVPDLAWNAGKIVTISADVADSEQVRSLLEKLAASMPPLKGIFHCAGVVDPVLVAESSWDRFADSLAPKLAGGWNLHSSTKDLALDHFVLFSSAAAILASPGLASYAAANASLDALAEHRRHLGLPALSVNWGPWSNTGMARAAAPAAEAQWATFGMDSLPPGKALSALGRLLSMGSFRAAVLSMRWDKALATFSGTPPPYLAEIAPAAGATRPESPVFGQLLSMPAEQRAEFLALHLQNVISGVLQADTDRVSPDANLTQLGMDSLMVMEVFNRMREDLQFVLYPREFYDRPTIRDLAPYLATEFERIHGAGAQPSPVPIRMEIVEPPEPLIETPHEAPLPGIAFILSSPRSGSTLLRVMLAGHPDLFVPPELHLLPFQTMDERKGKLSLLHLDEGLQRALMELDGLDAESSRRITDEWSASRISTREAYRRLQQRLRNRLLIDKSPSYGALRQTLERAERLFDGARYIHLVRHPAAVMESFVRMRMDRLLTAAAVDSHEVAEQVWTIGNQNIREVLARSAPERYHLVRFEDLVRNPRDVMERVCAFLEVPFDPAVLRPYEGQRMTDGVHARSAPIGDPNFLKHDRIEPSLGDATDSIELPRGLSAGTRALAAELGYAMPHAPADMRERYIESRGLRLCVCEWGAADAPLVVLVHGILDQGAAWEKVAEALAEKGFHVVAPDLRGHGRSDHVGAGGSYHLLDFVADLDAVMRAICGTGRFTLVGHSLGSIVAGMYAAARPVRIDALALVEVPLADAENGNPPDGARRLAAQLDYFASSPGHAPLPDLSAAAARLRSATPEMPEAMALRLAERITKPRDGGRDSGLEWRWDPMLATRVGIAFDGPAKPGDLRAMFESNVPVTIVAGRGSPFASRGPKLELLAKGRSQVRVASIAGGHSLHLENPAGLADLIADAAQLRQEPMADTAPAPAPSKRVPLDSRFLWPLRPIWEIPLAAFSWIYFRYVRAVMSYGLKRYAARQTQIRWAPLSEELMAVPWATAVFMTTGPRWNTHAIIASAGPLPVESTLTIDATAANQSAKSWSLVIYAFPGNKTVASVGSNPESRLKGRHTVELPRGTYSLGLRYYGWNRLVELPEIAADGRKILEPSLVPGDVNEFYDDLRSRETWFYRWMHYYVFVLLRFRRMLPRSFVSREFLPVGDTATFFLYDYIRKGEFLDFEIDATLLEAGPVYLTFYSRASFPVRWYRVEEPRHVSAPIERDGFYLVRIPRGGTTPAETIAGGIKVHAQPHGRPAAWSAARP